ncbi:lipase 2 [Colletotrichum liriopes]|uniref:Lipase 2 n=1 Tax=Colletotrichum liriopes TaxID=708192 RepID=A0AA37LSV8_9PEZI|nr:lipase 2 [Colletotrichum liriopes]
MLRTIKDIALAFVRPTLDALFFGRHLPWSLRWRLLALQPIVFLTNSLVLVPTLFRRPYTVIHIPVNPGRSLRALLFKEPGTGTGRKGLRPLHVDCHAGGFVGGIPEASVPFCSLVAAETGAVVISLSYRLAPVHPFPAAIDDVDAAIAWLRQHAAEEFGADPTLMTVSGASAGGNLVLAANRRIPSEEFAIRAAVTFYAPVDLRLGPEDKPAIDILVQEQLMFVERVKNEREEKGKSGSSIEAVFVEEAFHGWLEVPNSVIPMEKKMTMLDKGLELVKHTHTQYGYRWEKAS